jgi:hypothetical protein
MPKWRFPSIKIDLCRQLPSETEVLEFKEWKTNVQFDQLCTYCVAIAMRAELRTPFLA